MNLDDMELVYCKKDYFEFKKGNYYYCNPENTITMKISPSSTTYLSDLTYSKFTVMKENEQVFRDIREKEFYKYFLSHEKTKRKLKLKRIKKNIKKK